MLMSEDLCCRDEDSKPNHLVSEKSALPLGNCPSLSCMLLSLLSVGFATGAVKKGFWVVVMMGMLAGLIYSVAKLTLKYLDHPVSVSVNIVQDQQMVFPSVTICNMSPVKKSSMDAANNPTNPKTRRKRSPTGALHQWPVILFI